jgi:hypothetical protein
MSQNKCTVNLIQLVETLYYIELEIRLSVISFIHLKGSS